MRARKYTSFDVEGEGTCHMVLSAQGFVYFEFMAGAAEAIKHQEPFLLPTESSGFLRLQRLQCLGDVAVGLTKWGFFPGTKKTRQEENTS